MTKEELAARLNGSQYPVHRAITSDLRQAAKAAGLVIVYGASDDLMEFDGAVYDEVGCYDGGTVRVDARGVLPYRDCLETDEEIVQYTARKQTARAIEALWCKVVGYSWPYKTDIPHATFEVVEDCEPYCRGIVFALADLA